MNARKVVTALLLALSFAIISCTTEQPPKHKIPVTCCTPIPGKYNR
jgi:hypothetical protein